MVGKGIPSDDEVEPESRAVGEAVEVGEVERFVETGEEIGPPDDEEVADAICTVEIMVVL